MLTPIEECISTVGGEFDLGLLTGGALEVLSSVVRDRICVQLPAVAEPWDDRDGWLDAVSAGFVLFGPRGEPILKAVGRTLEHLWGSSPPRSTITLWPTEFPLDPPWRPGVLLVPATRVVQRVPAGSGFPPEAIARLRAIKDLPGRRIVVRLNEPAATAYRRQVRHWSHQRTDPEVVSVRIHRWLFVAALLAIWEAPQRPTISADLLVMAELLAIENHELVCWTIKQELIEKPGHLTN